MGRANGVRIPRGEVRRKLQTAELSFEDFLDEIPTCCASAPVHKVLCWLPGIRAFTAREILDNTTIAPEKPIAELTHRELYALYARTEPRIKSYLCHQAA